MTPSTPYRPDRGGGISQVRQADGLNEQEGTGAMPGPMRNYSKAHSRGHSGPQKGLRELPPTCSWPVPDLPAGRAWTDAEREHWESIWTGPQGNAYDDSFIAAVAAYVCHASAIYSGTASAWQAQEFRHLGAQLGLTPAGMLALGWVIAEQQPQPKPRGNVTPMERVL